MGKQVTILLVGYLVICSLLMVIPVYAQAIPKPSVPEFTFKLLENYYHPTIEITIKNQVYPVTVNNTEPHLYYNLRTKNQLEENWNEQYSISETTLPLQSSYEYTTLTYTPSYSTGDRVDLQVEALLGYKVYTTYPEHPTVILYDFKTLSSNWSPTQTFTMPFNPTPQPSPSKYYAPDNLLLVIITVVAVVALALALLSLVLLKKRT